MKLSMGSQCIKYLMFIFNLLFVITGLILLITGSVIYAKYMEYFDFLNDNQFLSVPNLLIATGVIIFFIAFFGCCGAVKENYCMILAFTSSLILIFILELAGGISGYVLRDQVHDVVKTQMNQSMYKYHPHGSMTLWDQVQTNLDCCGVNNASDWRQITKTNDSLPSSCCYQAGFNACTMQLNYRKTGCLEKMGELLSSHAVELGGVGLGVAFFQGIGIIFSIYLARAIKRSYETV